MKKQNELRKYQQIAQLAELLRASIVGICKSVKRNELSLLEAKQKIKNSIACFVECSLSLIEHIKNQNSATITKSVNYIGKNLTERSIGCINKIVANSNSANRLYSIAISDFWIEQSCTVKNPNGHLSLMPTELITNDIRKMKFVENNTKSAKRLKKDV